MCIRTTQAPGMIPHSHLADLGVTFSVTFPHICCYIGEEGMFCKQTKRCSTKSMNSKLE